MRKLIVEVHKQSDLQKLVDQANVPDGMMMVEGVFGRVDSPNRNKRLYSRAEYEKHVNIFNSRIAEERGIFGELEHPKSMNIDLNNVSHKVMDLRVDEDGFVRGRALLLDTPKGKIAQSIVRSGSPLPISSRAIGHVKENGEVLLETLATYDLVGTAGFAETNLKMIGESKDEKGNVISTIYEHVIDDNGDVVEDSKLDSIVESVKNSVITRLSKDFVARTEYDKFISEKKDEKEDGKGDEPKGDEAEKDGKKGEDDVKESLTRADVIAIVNERFKLLTPVIENWVTNDFGQEFGNIVESWVKKDVLPHNAEVIENWMKNDFSNHLGTSIQTWMMEDFSTVIENWITNDVLPHNAEVTESWVKKDVLPQMASVTEKYFTEILENKADKSDDSKSDDEAKKEDDKKSDDTKKPEKVDESYQAQANIFSSSILESIDKDIDDANKKGEDEEKEKKKKENVDETFYQDNAPVWLRKIPSEFKVVWESLNENQRQYMYNRAAVRTLVTENDIRTFWNSTNMQMLTERKNETSKNRNQPVNESFEKNSRAGIAQMAKILRK